MKWLCIKKTIIVQHLSKKDNKNHWLDMCKKGQEKE